MDVNLKEREERRRSRVAAQKAAEEEAKRKEEAKQARLVMLSQRNREREAQKNAEIRHAAQQHWSRTIDNESQSSQTSGGVTLPPINAGNTPSAHHLTEEEELQIAIQNSLLMPAGTSGVDMCDEAFTARV